MKTLLFLAFFIFSNDCFSQFFVGDRKQDVKSALIEKNIDFTEERLTDTTSRISWLKQKEFQMIWVFNDNDIVTRQTLIPESKNGLNEFVKWFNEDYVALSPTEWRNYQKDRIFQIKLEYILKEPFFSITLLENP